MPILVGYKFPFMNTNWVLVGDSVAGQSHIKHGIPCQDAHYYALWDNGWGIAVVADGAGSSPKAHIGSEFIVQTTWRIWGDILEKQGWMKENRLPEADEWDIQAQEGLHQIYLRLEEFSQQQQIPLKELSATLIVVIFSPIGILCTHIGDGRAAYCNQKEEWKALMQPWKGEYANETVFINSEIWAPEHRSQYIQSTLITEAPLAFALLSDGCERHSFVCNVWDEASKKYIDPNQPFEKFFKPLTKNLHEMQKQGMAPEAMKAKWSSFLQGGNSSLKNEPDDKTMILGTLLMAT